MGRPRRGRALSSLLVALAVSTTGLAGCSATATVTSNGQKIIVVQHGANLTLAPGQADAMTVSCASGETMVSGGFFSAQAQPAHTTGVIKSYPSDSAGAPPTTQGQTEDSWTVRASNASSATVTYLISVNCVTGIPITTGVWYQPLTQLGDLGYSATPNCPDTPTELVLTGGGFLDPQPQGSYGQDVNSAWATPTQGWFFVRTGGPGGTAYAVCAKGIVADPPIWAHNSAANQLGPDHYQADVGVACPQNEVLVGGGFDIWSADGWWPLSDDSLTPTNPTQWRMGFDTTVVPFPSELSYQVGVEGICVESTPKHRIVITFSNYHHLLRIPADTVVVATDGSGQVKASQVSANVSRAQSEPIAAQKTATPGAVLYSVPAGCGDPTPAIDAATAALRHAVSGKVPAGQIAFGAPTISINRDSLTCSPEAGTSRAAPFTYVQLIDGSATQGLYSPLDVSAYQREQLQRGTIALGSQYVLRDTLICPQGPQLVSATSTRATVQCTAYGVAEWQWTGGALSALARSLAGKHKDEALRLLDATPGVEPGTSTIEAPNNGATTVTRPSATLPGDPNDITIIVVRPQDTSPVLRAP